MTQTPDSVRAFYDRAAAAYARKFSREMDHKPMDREMIDRFVAAAGRDGPVIDLGCGPGEIAAHLHHRGLDVCGIDLSPRMVDQARSLHPGVAFREGNLLDLDLETGSVAAAVAFYAIVHFSLEELAQALSEVHRVLRQGGRFLLTFHIGEEVLHHEELLGAEGPIDFLFFRTADVVTALGDAGFGSIEVREREPYPEVEYPSRRAYVTAVR